MTSTDADVRWLLRTAVERWLEAHPQPDWEDEEVCSLMEKLLHEAVEDVVSPLGDCLDRCDECGAETPADPCVSCGKPLQDGLKPEEMLYQKARSDKLLAGYVEYCRDCRGSYGTFEDYLVGIGFDEEQAYRKASELGML